MATGVRVRDPIVRGGADAGTDADTGTSAGTGAGTDKRSRGELDHDVARSMPSQLDARVAWSAFIQRAG
ncbi:MAG TPA: hypothetical protein VE093_20280 [Polyangiaceae bacterium]|nr:hypothetical protein [Polyangiaceae bacterium]